ncbi:uncharacterized protein LOC114950765 isoform X2 [Acropora millepora]|uniref:uncharacterized protein LOC114950765 isoform X2 n=1 Tax=Acropora millepora TaxID=45264 RepID=UPI001CF4BAD1|nr:uncharacterized protein LOC114950765 isoform X2 [Acropora millepora]
MYRHCFSNMAGYYSTSVGESDIFEAIKGEVLIYLRDFLVDKLATDKIITYLRSKRILDQSDEEDIRAERTTIQKNSKLLDLVDSRGSEDPKGFPPATFNGSISIQTSDPKLTVVIPGLPESHQVDLSNLPCPGDPGAPVPPDELENNPTQVMSHCPLPSTGLPSYTSDSPPPYSE